MKPRWTAATSGERLGGFETDDLRNRRRGGIDRSSLPLRKLNLAEPCVAANIATAQIAVAPVRRAESSYFQRYTLRT